MSIKKATRDAYGAALKELAASNTQVVVLDADLSKSTKTADFAAVAPERFFNSGIAEANMVGVAAGLAAAGKVPFVSSFAVFACGRAFEQIRNSVAYPALNVKIAATHAGISVGEDGGSHQSIEDIALMRVLPNMTVLVPADAIEARQAVLAAAAYQGPVYIRLGRLAVPQAVPDDYQFQIGKGYLCRSGRDIAIVACGMMVGIALEAADLLSQAGIEAAVIDMASIKPLDQELILQQADVCGAMLSVEEHSIIGGLGSAVAEVLAENTSIPFARLGVKDSFGQSGSPAALLEHYGLSASHIAAAAQAVIAKK